MPEEMQALIREGVQDNFRSTESELRIKRILKKYRDEEAVFQMNHVVDKNDLKAFSKVEVSEEKIKITLRSPVLFASGQSELRSGEARAMIGEIATIIKGLPNRVVIEGHTDNTPVRGGPFKNNWELSLARALSIERLLEQKGVNPAILNIAGYAEYAPLYPNETDVGKAFNRRIEINILR